MTDEFEDHKYVYRLKEYHRGTTAVVNVTAPAFIDGVRLAKSQLADSGQAVPGDRWFVVYGEQVDEEDDSVPEEVEKATV